MKKRGFTLAEVLITLAIIGVVSAITLPALNANIGEQQYKTALRKGINTLTEAASLAQAQDGWDYGSIIANSDAKELKNTMDADTNARSLTSLLKHYAAVDTKSTQDSAKTGLIQGNTPYTGLTVVFRDGSSLMFPTTAGNDDASRAMQYDGLSRGFVVLFDSNGKKGPNLLSNCSGQINQAPDFDYSETFNYDGGCSKTGRIIKDQFTLLLRGNVAEPYGTAAYWAVNN